MAFYVLFRQGEGILKMNNFKTVQAMTTKLGDFS